MTKCVKCNSSHNSNIHSNEIFSILYKVHFLEQTLQKKLRMFIYIHIYKYIYKKKIYIYKCYSRNFDEPYVNIEFNLFQFNIF